MQHFGPEAPALLNDYSVMLQDAVIAQAEQTVDVAAALEQTQQGLQETRVYLGAALEDNAAYQELVTDIDLLTDYYNELTGPGGIYETLTPEEQSEMALREEVARNAGYPGGGSEDPALMAEMQQRMLADRGGSRYQRPGMDIQEVEGQGNGEGGFQGDWLSQFAEVRRANPAAAYQFLDAINGSPALAQALLISDQPPL